MSSSLKTLVLRAPTRTANLVCCPKASFPTTTISAIRIAQPLFFTRTFADKADKPGPDFATASQRWVDAGKFKTASDLGARRPSSENPHVPASHPTTSGEPVPMDWNTFFQLRLKRRRVQVFFSAVGGLAGCTAGAGLLASGVAEPLVMQVPLDPFMSMGLMTIACAVLGWLAGPSIGNQVFYLTNRRLKMRMKEKEAEFFTRVRKNRVDPANSGAGNPVPDFYGEKIQSVKGYRQWLKDQRAFNKKKTSAFV